jgi:hypothetical protein
VFEQLVTQDQIIKHIKEIETNLLVSDYSSYTWRGIEFRWVNGNKRDGCILKRNGHYGSIKYYDTLHFNYDAMEYFNMSYEEMLKIIKTSHEVRKLNETLRDIEECSICGKVGIGLNDREDWKYIIVNRYHKNLWNNNKTIDTDIFICSKCLEAIADGKIKRSNALDY